MYLIITSYISGVSLCVCTFLRFNARYYRILISSKLNLLTAEAELIVLLEKAKRTNLSGNNGPANHIVVSR